MIFIETKNHLYQVLDLEWLASYTNETKKLDDIDCINLMKLNILDLESRNKTKNWYSVDIIEYENNEYSFIRDENNQLWAVWINWLWDEEFYRDIVSAFEDDIINEFIEYHIHWWKLWDWLDCSSDYNLSVVRLVENFIDNY